MQWRKHSLELILTAALASFAHGAFGEEGKAEGGEGKAAVAQPKDQKEFGDKTSRMNSLATRIAEDERQFSELVQAKSETKNTEEKQRIIKQLVEIEKDRNKSVDEYNKIKSQLALRYPNQGEHLNRHYETQMRKSLEELEGTAGLDEMLTRTKKVIKKKYETFDTEQEKSAKNAEEKSEKAPAAEQTETKKLRLEK